jgi:hypothetical protein
VADERQNAGAKDRAGERPGQALECPFRSNHRTQIAPAIETGAIETVQTA